MRQWLDHRGELITAPMDAPPTSYGTYDQLTHALMTDGLGVPVQAITRCGRRALEVPGRGEVDCPECLEP